jgi:multicomponent K+:H+ antiporter subunit A
MAAPTPVSAYLHSATMVKAGVFLLARLYPALGGSDLWFWLVSGTGAATLVYAAAIALFRNDIKGLLAYSTISHLGLITLLFGLDTPLSVVAGLFHIINHAIFKASLFMAAGVIDHECGTRDMRRVNGMFRRMPITATLAIIAAGSMAGVPLLNGFLSKEMFFAETVSYPQFETLTWVLPLFATIAGMLAVAYSSRFVHDVFFNGEPVDLPRQPHEPPRWMRAPIELLVLLCLLVGLFPGWTVGPLLAAAAGAALQAPLPEFTLALWHGFNQPLLMSVLALAGGVILYALRAPLFAWQAELPPMHPRTAFERFYRRLNTGARWTLAAIDNGSLQRYNALLFSFIVLLGGWAFFSGPAATIRVAGQPIDEASVGALLTLLLGTVGATLLYRQRLLAVILVSVVGLVVALTFIRLSAPDLALTQFAVETGTIILMLLVLYYLPSRQRSQEQRPAADPRPAAGAARRWRPRADHPEDACRAVRDHLGILSASGDPRRRRRQRRQCDPGRFSRFRYARRNHRAGDGCAGRACPARPSDPARPAGGYRWPPLGNRCPPALSLDADAPAAALFADRLGVHPAARPQPARRRFCRRPDHQRRTGHAIPGERHRLRAAAHAGSADPVPGAGLAAGGRQSASPAGPLGALS